MIFLQTLPFNIPFDWGSFAQILIWGLAISVGLGVMIVVIRNKMKYVYYGIVLRRREQSVDGIPQSIILHGKAGYFATKTGKIVFRIKYGAMPWHVVETSDTPDPKNMIGNMAVFFQLDKDNVIQAKTAVDWEGQGIKLIPVKDDLKFHHRISMKEVDEILETRKMSPVIVSMIIIGLIIVTGIIVFYFLGQA